MSIDCTLMDFGHALKMLKEGHTVSRDGWHDPSMFLYLVPKSTYASLTEVAQRIFGDNVNYGAYISLKTENDIVVPWQPTNSDILAEDWKVIK